MKNLLLLLSLSLIAFSCKKSHTSYWQVNDESFSTNQINYSYSMGGAAISTKSTENGFSMTFETGGSIPTQGTYGIGSNSNNPMDIDMQFYYHGKRYIPAQPGVTNMQASAIDNKAILTIPPTWFKRLEFDSSLTPILTGDSVIIQGKLSEP